MDPTDPSRPAAGRPGYPISSGYNSAGARHPNHPAPYQGYPPHQHVPHGTGPNGRVPPFAAMPNHGHAFRASPPNVAPQPIMRTSSPYFQNSYSGQFAPPASHATGYLPPTLPGYDAALSRQNGNRIILPPLRPTTHQNHGVGVSALESTQMNNGVATSNNINASEAGVPGVSAPLRSGMPIAHQHMDTSLAQYATVSLGNSNAKSAATASIRTSANLGETSSLANSGATSIGLGGGASTYHSTQTSWQQATLPAPENEPPSSLPPMPKRDSIKLHHHPDLPFLVTNWVDCYASSSADYLSTKNNVEEVPNNKQTVTGDREEAKKKEALMKLQNAAKDMAWAFETLGVFGDSSKEPIISTGDVNTSRRTTYTDLKRRYGPVLSSICSTNATDSGSQSKARVPLLDSLVIAGSSASNEASKSVLETVMPWSFLEAAYEGTVPTAENSGATLDTNTSRQSAGLGVGRRVGESSVSTSDQGLEHLVPNSVSTGSVFRNPVLMGGSLSATVKNNGRSSVTDGKLAMALGSNFETVTKKAAEASRKYVSLRMKMSEEVSEYQKTRMAMKSVMARAQSSGPVLALGDQSGANPDIDQQRVIAQLQRRLGEMHLKISSVKKETADAKKESDNVYQELSSVHNKYSDPRETVGNGNFLPPRLGRGNLSNLTILKSGRLSQLCKNRNFMLPRVITQQYQCTQRHSEFANTQLSILKSRLSHAVTISCHLIYPVYCLKFDKTGRYFITGADDQLVKLFYLGAGPKHGDRPAGQKFSYGANIRGAVLVCTLRGHAGVVTDLDVSADNAMLATASVDGDVRIWGMRDGCPIAILRGHKDGANMVSWSSLTPYRLVTCGDDGLARMWDVRKAALKRYNDVVGNRTDYTLPNEKEADEENESVELDSEMLPPVPMPQPNPAAPSADDVPMQEHNAAAPELAPGEGLMPGVNNVNVANLNDDRGNPGEFIANDAIDEGVTLIARMQHGEAIRESQQGVGTRARRKAVKVMCIARCPIGGHFATGSDDGLGRIWADSDDIRVENLDLKMSESIDENFRRISPMFTRNVHSARQRSALGLSSAPSKERLLTTLPGHNNAITDMKYSNLGDRILTASMKDGVVRVWSWGKESPIIIDGLSTAASASDFTNNAQSKFSNITHLLIRLTPVNQSNSQDGAQTSRRKGLASAVSTSSSVHCDGVTWTCDDTKIVTAQSSPAKATGIEIVPGSHMIYVWDSFSGRCLLGIHGSHTSLSSTLVAHPFIPSVVVSAGADGLARMWDLDRGDCFYSHKNTLLHGPIENASMRGKPCSYLEGQFSPDGSYLILSDETGRISVFDTMPDHDVLSAPAWMNEQYYANDYYELFYDSNGYCIERGSECPPHLAPRGVRCNHEGVGVAENVRDVFVNLSGPRALPPDAVRWSRNDIRNRNHTVHMDNGALICNDKKKAFTLVESPGMLVGCQTTAIITSDGKLFEHSQDDKALETSGFGTFNLSNRTSTNTSSGRTLSSRYTWVDFNDIADEDDDQYDETDDEEYRGEGQRLSGGRNDDDHHLSDVEDEESPVRVNQSRQRVQGRRRSTGQRSQRETNYMSDAEVPAQPTRSSSRQASRRPTNNEADDDDEDEFIEELVSTHTKPSGHYARDWLTADHFFKMPRGSDVNRKWLSRTSSQCSYIGTKAYCPQVGDSVVYIPRAHYDTLQMFPTGEYAAPWKSWPTTQPWPVVRCKVTHVRYRFPYEMYFASGRRTTTGLKDVAVILTLEITGVPYNCDNRIFPWPAPVFTAPIASRTRSHDSTFEVTMFDSGQTDFVIPELLYICRIKGLEKAIEQNGGNVSGLAITINFPPDSRDRGYGSEDPSYISYQANLVSYVDSGEDEYHFQGSGYNALNVTWDDPVADEETIPVCAWDAQVTGLAAPKVPEMSTEVKNAVNAALKQVMNSDPQVKEWYECMPDCRIYSDYLLMVEVPMYLQHIRRRMQNNYYTNKSSVVADMELIKENCYKYNEDNNEFYDLACEMHNKFEELVKAIPDNPRDNDSNESDIETIIRRGMGNAQESAASLAPVQRSPNRSRRMLSRVRSSLANLPGSGERALRRSTRSASTGNSDGVSNRQHLEGQENEDESPRQSARSNRSSRRQSSRTQSRSRHDRVESEEGEEDSHSGSEEKAESEQEEDDLSGSEEEFQPAQPTTRKSTRPKSQQGEKVRSSRVSTRPKRKPSHNTQNREESDEDESLHLTRASRQRAKRASRGRTINHSQVDDSNDETDSGAEESDDYEEAPSSNKRTRIHVRLGKKSCNSSNTDPYPKKESPVASDNARSSSRNRQKVSYAEVGSDVEEYIDESSVEEEESDEDDIPNKKKRTRSQSFSYTHGKYSPQKKRAKASPSQKRQKRGDVIYPTLTKWPSISKRMIGKVGRAVLRILRERDEENLFSQPVAEGYPSLADDYLSVIKEPMDFRTIEETRLSQYDHISELQDDLVLTFQNCCVFNGEDSDYFAQTIEIWQSINEIFKDACEETHVNLPTSFS